MDTIKEIISTLNKEDKKEFRVFIKRQRNRESRKDIVLFELLQKDNLYRNDLIKKLYPDNNKNAYHSLRKRLIKHLTEFITLKSNYDDPTNTGAILNLLSLAKYLFRKKQNMTGWKYLNKAEAIANNSNDYQLLNSIYYLQIEQSESEFAPPLRNIIKKKKENFILAHADDRANTANYLIKFRLKEARSSGKDFDIDKIVHNVLEENKLTDEVKSHPKLMYNILSIIRSHILAKKEFIFFEKYLLKSFKKLESQKSFDQSNHIYKINFLYMIAHVLYRNGKFSVSDSYLKLLYENILAYNKVYYELFYPSYILLLCNNTSYSGNPQKSILILEENISNKEFKLEKVQYIFAHLNLSAYYCQINEFSKAIKTLSKIQRTDNWLIKNVGPSHAIKMRILELALHFEVENYDFADNKLKSVEKAYKSYLDRNTFLREKSLIRIIKKLNKNPMSAKDVEIINEIRLYIDSQPLPLDDLQSGIFYVWLRAKTENKSFNEIILEGF